MRLMFGLEAAYALESRSIVQVESNAHFYFSGRKNGRTVCPPVLLLFPWPVDYKMPIMHTHPCQVENPYLNKVSRISDVEVYAKSSKYSPG
jgi:hypothetical protein